MDFEISGHDASLVKRAEAFAAAHPDAGWTDLCEDKWPGLCIPAEFGGHGERALAAALAFEALGRCGVDRGLLFALGAHLFGFSMALVHHGTQQQKADLLPKLASGEAIGALAFTEPAGGSDLGACATRLQDDGNGLRLSGRKTCVTNGATADVFLVLVRSRDENSPFSYTMVVVPRTAPGLSVEPIEGVRGLAQSAPAEIIFDDCTLPADAVLSRQGLGMAQLLDAMRWERSCILAGSLGALHRDLETCRAHLGEKARHQAVAHSLARLRTEMEAARWLLLRGAWGLQRGGSSLAMPAMSKLFVSETLVRCTEELRRLAAGAAWRGELGLADALDDALAILSASGTSEVQLNTIASQMGGSA